MDSHNSTLIVRNLPPNLTEPQTRDLMNLFKATSVRHMGSTGPLKHCVFVTFPTQNDSTQALKQLHQLKVLNFVLRVEYAKPQQLASQENGKELITSTYGQSDSKNVANENDSQTPKRAVEPKSKINSISKAWDLNYEIDDSLVYRYPSPTETTLQNIVHCMASVPKFYVQVLHLMNKMNLPPPFGELTTRPPVPDDSEQQPISSEESELESSDENSESVRKVVPQKRRNKFSTEIYAKRLRMQLKLPEAAHADTPLSKPTTVQDAFEVVREQAKQVKVNLPPQVTISQPSLQDTDNSLSSTEQFGRIEPPKADSVDVEDSGEDDLEAPPVAPYITSRELLEGRLSENEREAHPVLKKQSAGEPCQRLYVKNLAKNTTYDQLKYIFGRYVNWSDEKEAQTFNIRHMTEGRMKGQAFITLPNIEAAKAAVVECHAYLLNDKPMAIVYAKSTS